jgi:hypothetical protein
LQPLADSSKETADIARQNSADQLAWAKEQDAKNRETLQQVLGKQNAVQDEQLANARLDRSRYQQIYQPLEDNLVKDFQNYDSPTRRAADRSRAIADVNQSFDAQRTNALQRLEGYGVDPSMVRNQALDVGVRTAQAQAQAAAGTNAARNTEAVGRSLRAEALNIGKGYPSNVAGAYGQVLNAGNSQVGNANATTAGGAASFGAAGQGLNTALQGYNSASNISTQGFQNASAAAKQNSDSITGAISGVAGIAGMFMADGGEPRQAIPMQQVGPVQGPGDGSGIDDQVPAMLSVKEYVIPADVVQAKGREFFDKLLQKYHTPAAQQRAAMA